MAVYGVKKVVLVPTVFTAKAMIDVLKFGSDDSKEKAVSVLMSIFHFIGFIMITFSL